MSKEEIEARQKLYAEHKERKLPKCGNCKLYLLETITPTRIIKDNYGVMQEYCCKNCGSTFRILGLKEKI